MGAKHLAPSMGGVLLQDRARGRRAPGGTAIVQAKAAVRAAASDTMRACVSWPVGSNIATTVIPVAGK